MKVDLSNQLPAIGAGAKTQKNTRMQRDAFNASSTSNMMRASFNLDVPGSHRNLDSDIQSVQSVHDELN